MSHDFMIKQIEVYTVMLGEDRPEVEKHIINEELVALYRAKVQAEMRERMSAE